MKRLLLLTALLAALVPAVASARASAPVTTVAFGDTTCLHVENPDGAMTYSTIIEWTIYDPAGVAYDDPNFNGRIFYSAQPNLTWACVANSTLAAAGSGWTATVKISRAKSAGGTTSLAFF